MFDFSYPHLPNHNQWNGYRAPHNPQRMPYHGPRAPFRPRNQGFHNYRPQQAHQNHDGNQEHWCETCDRGFPTEQLLNNHKQQHQKCNIDGCQFVAHPKVITNHIQMQHSSGLFKKIAKLNNPEEIERWREERRKKYPTKVNIDKKDAELKEKINRGEKMGLGKKEWIKKDITGQGQKRCFNQTESKLRKPNRRNTAKRPKVLPTPEENRSLIPFPGIRALAMDSNDDEEEDKDEDISSHNLIEDDDLINTDIKAIQEDKTNNEKPVVCGALSSLMCDYGTSDDEEIDDSVEQKTNNKFGVIQGSIKDNFAKNKILHVHSAKTEEACNGVPKVMDTICSSGNENKCMHKLLKCVDTKYDDGKQDKLNNKPVIDNLNDNSETTTELKNMKYSFDSGKPNMTSNNVQNGDDDSGPEEIRVEKNNKTENISADVKNKQNKKKVDFVKRKPIYRKPKPKMPSTLIYKLLSKEMKQERNKVLQCVRYIIKHDFFNKSSKSS